MLQNKYENKLINWDALEEASKTFKGAEPFDYCVVDSFLDKDVAEILHSEFPDYNDESAWFSYSNAIENKKVCNNWNVFPPLTYTYFNYVNSNNFLNLFSDLFELPDLVGDPGLNGGGWHIHGEGGHLNHHLDYSIHPKLDHPSLKTKAVNKTSYGYQRKINVILYLNKNWDSNWGGELGLYAQGSNKTHPGPLVKSITPGFNKAIIFDTSQNSWHGLVRPLTVPKGIYRKSLAVYFLCEATAKTDKRGKALFAPDEHQKGNAHIEDLIKKRSQVTSASDVYQA